MQFTILINYYSSSKLASLKVLDGNNKVVLKKIQVSVPSFMPEASDVMFNTISPKNELFQYDENKEYSEMYYKHSKQFGIKTLNNDSQIVFSAYKKEKKENLPVDRKSFMVSYDDFNQLFDLLQNKKIKIVAIKSKMQWFNKSLKEKCDINKNYDLILKKEEKLIDDMSFYSNVNEIATKRGNSKSNLIIHKNKDLKKSLSHIESLSIEDNQDELNDLTFSEPKKA